MQERIQEIQRAGNYFPRWAQKFSKGYADIKPSDMIV